MICGPENRLKRRDPLVGGPPNRNETFSDQYVYIYTGEKERKEQKENQLDQMNGFLSCPKWFKRTYKGGTSGERLPSFFIFSLIQTRKSGRKNKRCSKMNQCPFLPIHTHSSDIVHKVWRVKDRWKWRRTRPSKFNRSTGGQFLLSPGMCVCWCPHLRWLKPWERLKWEKRR